MQQRGPHRHTLASSPFPHAHSRAHPHSQKLLTGSQLDSPFTFKTTSDATPRTLTSSGVPTQSGYRFITSPRCPLPSEPSHQKTQTSPVHSWAHHRYSLPEQVNLQIISDGRQELSSPEQRPSAKVNFTYKASVGRLPPNCSQLKSVQGPVWYQVAEGRRPEQVRRISKQSGNRLCSGVFNLCYSPFEQFRRKNQELRNLILQIKSATQMMASRHSGARNSKLTEETIVSAMQGVQDSAITSFSAKWDSDNTKWDSENTKWDSEPNPKTESQLSSLNKLVPLIERRSSLVDQMRSSKKLAETVILSQPTYDFGGLLSQGQSEQANLGAGLGQQERSWSSSRQWGGLRNLLSTSDCSEMKESIHCSPDTRSNKFSLEMLQGFGREIKESIVGFQE